MTKLKELRKEHKLSMKELGKILGLSESTISLYEAGKREPDIKTLIKMADYFDVSVDILLGRDETNKEETIAYLCLILRRCVTSLMNIVWIEFILFYIL